jgi:hypothetical protein
MDHAPRRLLVVALLGALAFSVTGCGGDSKGSAKDDEAHMMSATPSAQVTGAPPADAKVIGVTIGEDSVSPDGARIKVDRDQPVVLEIDAVAEGELHVHSTPEMEIEFPKGKSQVQFEIDKAGVVDVEDHGLDLLVVQLEVE